MIRDREDISDGKLAMLNDIQKEFIEKVAKDNPRNIFLWGSYSTGTTMLLAQALSIKISHYKMQGYKNLNVIVSPYVVPYESPLLQDLKEKYLWHLTSAYCSATYDFVRFIPFKKLCKGDIFELKQNFPIFNVNYNCF